MQFLTGCDYACLEDDIPEIGDVLEMLSEQFEAELTELRQYNRKKNGFRRSICKECVGMCL